MIKKILLSDTPELKTYPTTALVCGFPKFHRPHLLERDNDSTYLVGLQGELKERMCAKYQTI